MAYEETELCDCSIYAGMRRRSSKRICSTDSAFRKGLDSLKWLTDFPQELLSWPFPWNTVENNGEAPSDTTFLFWHCKYSSARSPAEFFWKKWKHCLIFCTSFNLQCIFWGQTVAHTQREMHLSLGIEQSQQLLLFHSHWHTWWHLIISCLNSDALEKRLDFPGGWCGSECVTGHGVFGKSKPLSAAWCLQSSGLHHVPKLRRQ